MTYNPLTRVYALGSGHGRELHAARALHRDGVPPCLCRACSPVRSRRHTRRHRAGSGARAEPAAARRAGCAQLPVAALRRYVSHGARGMLRAGFGLTTRACGIRRPARRVPGPLRGEPVSRNAICFTACPELLGDPRAARTCAWGIVTNKLERFTLPLVERLVWPTRAAAWSAAILRTCETPPRSAAGGEPPAPHRAARLLYIWVTTSATCRQARQRACAAIVAMYGYLGDGNPPQQWGADRLHRAPSGALEAARRPSSVG